MVPEEGSVEQARSCPWCSTVLGADETKCPKCGAAVAQREDLAGLTIPGVTAVDPRFRETGSVLQGVMRVQNAQNSAGRHVHMFVPGGDLAEMAIDAVVMAPLAAGTLRAGLELLSTPEIDTSAVGRPTEAALLQAEWLDEQERAARSGQPATEPAAAESATGQPAEPGSE